MVKEAKNASVPRMKWPCSSSASILGSLGQNRIGNSEKFAQIATGLRRSTQSELDRFFSATSDCRHRNFAVRVSERERRGAQAVSA